MVKFPGIKPIQVIQEEFQRIAGFTNHIGCINGTHIPIKAPSNNNYVNKKSIPSINVQRHITTTVVSQCFPNRAGRNLEQNHGSGYISNVGAKWSGSLHDFQMYRESYLSKRLQRGEFGGFLLGDRGYLCQPMLLTTCPDPEAGPQQNYNQAHWMTTGLLKGRFEYLRHIGMTPERASDVVVACVVLHNIAVIRQQHPPPQNEDPDDHSIHLPATQDGKVARDTICQDNFSL